MKFATIVVVASIITSSIAAPSPDPFSFRRRKGGSSKGLDSTHSDNGPRRGFFGTKEDMKRLQGKVAAGAVGGAAFGIAGVAIAKALEPKQPENDNAGGEAKGNLRPLNMNQLEKRQRNMKELVFGSFVNGVAFGAAFTGIQMIMDKVAKHNKEEEKEQQKGLRPLKQ